MPSYRAMGLQYTESKSLKFTIIDEAFGLMFTAIKNHESSTGGSIIMVNGYRDGVTATVLRRGAFITKLAYKKNTGSIDIYLTTVPYVFVSTLCFASANTNITAGSTLVESVPSDAVNVPLS